MQHLQSTVFWGRLYEKYSMHTMIPQRKFINLISSPIDYKKWKGNMSGKP